MPRYATEEQQDLQDIYNRVARIDAMMDELGMVQCDCCMESKPAMTTEFGLCEDCKGSFCRVCGGEIQVLEDKETGVCETCATPHEKENNGSWEPVRPS
jgi:putative hemolysin